MRLLLVLVPLGLAVALALSWYDVLPGGYRLRGWVKPHAIRRAEAQAAKSAERLAEFASETVPAGAIVFLGSSTMERFPLAELFPGKPCVDRGIGNESALECLERLHASLPDEPPAAFCVYLASIDFRAHKEPPAEVVARVGRILDELEARFPGVPIAQIGLLSERAADESFVRRWRATNAALEAAARERGVRWITVDRPPLTNPSGQLDEEMSADDLHLSDVGYRQLAAWILAEGGPLAALLAP